MKNPCWRRLLIVCAIVLAPYRFQSAVADDFIWKSTTGGVWANPQAWDPTGVPLDNDTATIGALQSGNIQLTGDVSVKTLSLGAVEIAGPGWLTVKNLSADGAGFHGPATEVLAEPRQVTILEGAQINGTLSTSRKIINYGIVNNFGSVRAIRTAANQYNVEEAPSWTNEEHSELHLPGQGDNAAFGFIQLGGLAPLPIQIPWLTNKSNALIEKFTVGISFVDWCFCNFGEVRVSEGSLTFNKIGRLDGLMHVAPDAKLILRTSQYARGSIGPNARFTGAGTIEIESFFPILLDSPQPIPNPVILKDAAFDGSGIAFSGPVNWRNLTGQAEIQGAGGEPIIFLLPSIGTGSLSRNIRNFSVAIDDQITPSNNVVWVNMPLSQFLCSDKSSGSKPDIGAFSNLLAARIDLGVSRDRNWNIYNDGFIFGPKPGTGMTLNGTLQNNATGEIDLQDGRFIVTNQFRSEGLISGFGGITSLVTHLGGTISPNSASGPFGKLTFRATKPSGLTVDASTVFKIDVGAGVSDQVETVGGAFRGRFDITAREGFTPGTYVIATYSAASAGPFTLGEVPPFYRFQLTNVTARRELQLIVTAPAAHIVTLRSDTAGSTEDNQLFNLDVATLPDISYGIEFTSDLNAPWQIITNFVGNGQTVRVPYAAGGRAGNFKITEGSP